MKCIVRGLKQEKHVVILSGTCGVLSLIVLIALGIVWTYWSDTLNINCVDSACGCIFYAHLRGTSFTGGHPWWCKVITHSTLILSIISFAVAGYFFSKSRDSSKHFPSRVTQNYEDENAPHQKRRSRFSVAFKVFCGVLAFLTFVHASTLTEGYSSTCKEYKTIVRRQLGVSGDVSDMINNRLSCAATYDFLDYIQTEQTSRYPAQYQYYQRRTFRIDTGTILLISITLTWINVAIWIFLTFFAGFCS